MAQAMIWNTHFYARSHIRNSKQEAQAILSPYLHPEDHFSKMPIKARFGLAAEELLGVQGERLQGRG